MKVTASRSIRTFSHADAPKPLKIDNLLVPIDFSPASLQAIQSALPLAKQFRAEVHLVHVFEPDYPLASMVAMPLIVPELEVGRRVRRHLKDVAAKYGIKFGPQNIHALRGRPFEEICRLAREGSADLISISTRGNTGLKHLLLGSTAERVVRYSPCPVLVVRPPKGKAARRRVAFKKILVPIDFSECSAQGLEYAKALARKFKARLILLHVVHPQYYVTNDEYMKFDLPALMEETEKAAEKQMRELRRRTDWNGIKVETLLETGHPGQRICDEAKDRGADLVVTSTHGTTGLKHALLGSTAEFVVRHSTCPVLVVPSHKRPTISSTKSKYETLDHS